MQSTPTPSSPSSQTLRSSPLHKVPTKSRTSGGGEARVLKNVGEGVLGFATMMLAPLARSSLLLVAVVLVFFLVLVLVAVFVGFDFV